VAKLFKNNRGKSLGDLPEVPYSRNKSMLSPKSAEHIVCNHCKNFIRRYGNIVSIDANMADMSICLMLFVMEKSASAEMSNAIKAQ
jgi:hypothetical protein